MDLKDLKVKKISELHSLLAKWRNELRELRFKDANGQLKNVREIRSIKKNVAKVLTLLNEGKDSEKNNKKEENK